MWPSSKMLKSKTPQRVVAGRGRDDEDAAIGRGEWALRLTGVALAIGSTAFASRMITNTDYHPQFAGMEYLSIFNKPSTTLAARIKGPRLARHDTSVDYAPVGAINPARNERVAKDFTLLEASFDFAIVKTPRGDIVRVAPGYEFERVGRVVAVKRRGDDWVVVTSSGAIIE